MTTEKVRWIVFLGLPNSDRARGLAGLLRHSTGGRGEDEQQRRQGAFHGPVLTKRCKNCQTLYQSRMRRIATYVLFALLLPTAAEAGKLRSTLRIHLEANARDGAPFSSPIRSPATGKSVVIQKVPTISERDVVAFAPYRAADGSYGALFELDDHGKLALDTLSLERRGTYLYVFVNGRDVAELQIDRRVSDGKLYLASGLTEKDIAQMKKDWRRIGERKRR